MMFGTGPEFLTCRTEQQQLHDFSQEGRSFLITLGLTLFLNGGQKFCRHVKRGTAAAF
jgi:hypothetical protein